MTFKSFFLSLLVTTIPKLPWPSGQRLKEVIICSPSERIYTVATPSRVECLGVKGDRIFAVGSYEDVSQAMRAEWHLRTMEVIGGIAERVPAWVSSDRLYRSSTAVQMIERAVGLVSSAPKVVNLHPSQALYPGFADAHAHVIENGYMLELPLVETQSLEDIVKALEDYILTHRDLQNDKDRWVEGMGWDQTKWNGGTGAEFPTAEDLDKSPTLKGRPVSLNRIDGHAKWVSPRVLEIMEEGGVLPPPSKDDEIEKNGGKILRGKDGKPTGIFVDKAMNLVPTPEWSEAQMLEYFNRTITLALKYGLTSIHDADTNPRFIAFYRKLAEAGTLPIRMYLMGYSPSTAYWGNDTASYPKLHNHGKHGRLNLRAAKLFADGGALGSWGAALLEPYSDKPESRGIMQMRPEVLQDLVERFWEDGWQTNIHSIGDRANKAVLDIFESQVALKDDDGNLKYDVRLTRPRIEHAQIFDRPDLEERIGTLGVIASVQPTYLTSEMWYAETRIGPERIKNAYAHRTLLQSSPKHVLPLGSDFPVEGVNPLLGFYAAVSRLSRTGTSPHGPGGWYPSQKLSRAEALKGMTWDAAYASFAEGELGSLEPGKKADFVVLDRDIMDEDSDYDEILKAQVLATVVDGQVAYRKMKFVILDGV